MIVTNLLGRTARFLGTSDRGERGPNTHYRLEIVAVYFDNHAVSPVPRFLVMEPDGTLTTAHPNELQIKQEGR